MTSNLTVGVIGLGAMGMGMAQSLRRAGHSVNVFDVRAEVAQKFAAEGGLACASLADIARASDVLISVVVNAAQTASVLFGDGATDKGCAQDQAHLPLMKRLKSFSTRWRPRSTSWVTAQVLAAK